MGRIIIAITALLLSVSSFSQTENSIIITPGVGIGPLKLGMSEKQAFAILKGKISWENYNETLKKFIGYGPEVDSVFQFVIGFDSCGTYGNELPESLPVYSIYFKDHKLNFITVSSYGTDEALMESVTLTNGLKFNDLMEDCTKKLGPDYISLEYYDENMGDHYYYKIGLEVVYDENGLLSSFGIFSPLPDAKEKIAVRSTELRRQAKEVKEKK